MEAQEARVPDFAGVLCWFCARRPAKRGCELKVNMQKPIASFYGHGSQIWYSRCIIEVPRCTRCIGDASRVAKARDFAVGLGCGPAPLIMVAYWAAEKWFDDLAAMMVFVIGLPIFAVCAVAAIIVAITKGRSRLKYSERDYPLIGKLRSRGWRIVQSFTGVEGKPPFPLVDPDMDIK